MTPPLRKSYLEAPLPKQYHPIGSAELSAVMTRDRLACRGGRPRARSPGWACRPSRRGTASFRGACRGAIPWKMYMNHFVDFDFGVRELPDMMSVSEGGEGVMEKRMLYERLHELIR